MKKLRMFAGLLPLCAMFSACSPTGQASAGYGYDDLYAIHDKAAIARKQQAEAEARKAAAEARRAEWEALMAEAQAANAEQQYYGGGSNPYDDILADTYESAYARRLSGFASATYRMPSSYYDFRYGSTFSYATAYDPAFYNIIISGDQVWVEPKYVTSMFGLWGGSPYGGWYFGWNSPSYSWWGYPSYGWGGWNYGMSWYYDPWRYGWGYPSWGYGGHGHYYHGWNGHGPHYNYDYNYGHGGGRYGSTIVNRPGANSSPSGTRYGSSNSRYGDRLQSGAPSQGRGTGSFGVRPGSSGGRNTGTVTSPGRSRNNNSGRTTTPNRNSGTNTYNRGNNYNSNNSSGSSYNRGSSSSGSSSSSGYSGGSSGGGSGTRSSGGASRNSGGR